MTPSSFWIVVDPTAQRVAVGVQDLHALSGLGRHGSHPLEVVDSGQHRVTGVLILLPPSEGKTAPRRGKPMDPGVAELPVAARTRGTRCSTALVELCTANADVAADTLGLGTTQADEVDRNAHLRTAPAARADRVYSGVLYEALDLASLEGAAKRRATSWVAVTSGLFGLVRPADRIPAYRLSGGVSLPGIGPVATYWSRHLDPAVQDAAGRGLVVDLRSSTYTPFWRPSPDTAQRLVTMRVLHEVNGTRKVVSHFNKATKGRIVRALLEDGSAASLPRPLRRAAARPRLEGRDRADRQARHPARRDRHRPVERQSAAGFTGRRAAEGQAVFSTVTSRMLMGWAGASGPRVPPMPCSAIRSTMSIPSVTLPKIE